MHKYFGVPKLSRYACYLIIQNADPNKSLSAIDEKSAMSLPISALCGSGDS